MSQRHPDIEVYVKDASVDALVEWLGTALGQQGPAAVSKKGQSIKVVLGTTPVTILEQAAGKRFTSVWLDSDSTPWETDLDCAKALHAALSVEVRCIRSGWDESQDPDEWWVVSDEGVKEILWKS